MKRILAIVMLLTVLLGCLLAPIGASAETTVTGKNNKTVTFKIKATRKNAYFVLSSSTGLAKVAQHNWLGRYKGDGNEVTHGFYKVTVKGKGLNKSMIWAPDATTNKSGVTTCREVQIKLPAKATYTVTVKPISNSAAAKYWRMDWIKSWVRPASWMVSITSGCTVKK